MAAGRRLTFLEWSLAFLVLLFAFAVSSFAAANSDLWLHLAAGRELAQGKYHFGVDPFAYTTEGVYWANHAWLFDLALYLAHQALGGAGLIVVKALGVALLAWLLLRFRPAGGPVWPAALCALLALLTMAPRLLVQPACLSLLLLAVALHLVWMRGLGVYWLPALLVLWVNVDAWFLLGVAVVALAWVWERVGFRPADAEPLPNWIVPACLAACLVSPHHVYALRLPDELHPAVWRSALAGDPRFAGLFASPWRAAPLTPAGGFNLAAYAFFLLLGLGVISFGCDRRALRDWRLPVWLCFAALAAWQVRLVGFFAVAGGAITALNLTSTLPATAGPRWARASLVLPALALLALCWPGWLTGFNRTDRRLAWEVRPDPSLVNASRALASSRERGGLREGDRVFPTHPDAAHHLAWFAPGEKSFLDSRFSLFLRVAGDYESLCAAVDPELRVKSPGPLAWQDLPSEYRIRRVLLYDPNLGRLGAALQQAAQPGSRWPLVRIEGQAVLLGVGGGSAARFDAEREAFGVPSGGEALPAPEEGPARLAVAYPWWLRFARPPSGATADGSAAAVYLRLFDGEQRAQQRRQESLARSRQAAGMVGVAALPSGPAGTALLLASRLGLARVFLPDMQERPAALPLLAARAARRALAENPGDARAWFVLARAYLMLSRATAEAGDHAALSPLAMVRQVQAATAFRQALVFDPDQREAHEALANLFAERNFLDLVLHHRSRALELTRGAGPGAGEDRTAFEERLNRAREEVEKLEREVEDLENRFAVRTQTLAGDPLARARIALELGLGGKALDDVLLKTSPLLFRDVGEGARLQIALLLTTGRAEEARFILEDESVRGSADTFGLFDLPAARGNWPHRLPAYDWFCLCVDAAMGRYGLASARLGKMQEGLARQVKGARGNLNAVLAMLVASEVGWHARPELLAGQVYARMDRAKGDQLWDQHRLKEAEPAALGVLGAMLDLERGDPAAAGEKIDRALEEYRDLGGDSHPGQSLAKHYAARLREARRTDRTGSP